MSNDVLNELSDQAITVAGVIYFLAFLAHVVQWVTLRGIPVAMRAEQPAVESALASSAGVRVSRSTASAGSEGGWTVEEVESAAGEDAARRVALTERLALILTGFAAAIHLVGLVTRGAAAEPVRVPWGNMYEFTISATFFVVLTYLVLLRRFRLHWLGPVVTGFTIVTLSLGMVVLHEPVGPLSEALNSWWLVIHVVAAIIATAAFTLGGFTSMLYLLRERAERKAGGSPVRSGYLARVPDLAGLDRITYRLHAFAFPVWTFGVLITGPIWAHEAWGRYWNWDPKEVWAFITWVVYAGYLHARATAGFKGRNAAYLALVGLATLWFNFIGINYFSSTSMHSYAAPEAPSTVVVGELVPGAGG